MDQAEAVARLVKLNGGKLVGKTRLQKSVYLLKSVDVDLGFDFDYHHYGPYSEELALASNDAKALGLINVEWRSSYGNDFAIFTTPEEGVRALDSDRARSVMKILEGYETTVLELAATADFLRRNGFGERAWDETIRRKASKVNEERIKNSRKLLREIQAA
jgi:uncharacterized protein YwgA